MRKLNKKGAEMTIGTIVIIVLALIVLVVLIVGFTGGWGNLWGRISAFFGGENVDAIVSACQVACSTNAEYDWCTRERTLKVKEGDSIVTKEKIKCVDLVTMNYGLERCDALESACGTTPEKPACDANRVCDAVGNEPGNCPTGQIDDTKTAPSGKVCCKEACTVAAGGDQKQTI
jgi:hypothetical protein